MRGIISIKFKHSNQGKSSERFSWDLWDSPDALPPFFFIFCLVSGDNQAFNYDPRVLPSGHVLARLVNSRAAASTNRN